MNLEEAKQSVDLALKNTTGAYWEANSVAEKSTLLEACKQLNSLKQQLLQQDISTNTESWANCAAAFQNQVLPAIVQLQNSLATSEKIYDNIKGLSNQLEQVASLAQFFGV